MPGEQ
jgi:hypothetical protein